MVDYGRVRSATRPPEQQITSRCIFLATNITSFLDIVDGVTQEMFEYDYVGYSKDEYLAQLDSENTQLKNELLDTQTALCDVYELLEGGLE